MKDWTKEDSKRLASYKYIVDNDNIRIKEIIKQKLINNDDIIHVLDNKELQESDAENDEYLWVNIIPSYIIHPTQTDSQNFICYTVGYRDVNRYNDVVKELHITFYILCEQKNLKDRDTGIARHDLLAALIQNEFNYTNFFGRKLKLIQDEESVTDNDYVTRVLTFTQTTDNNITKTKYGSSTRNANKEIHL
jgi:hypothetical protein